MPTDRDVLHAHHPDHGSNERTFEVGSLMYSFFDMNVVETAQQGCFYWSDDAFVTADLVCFLVSLSGYDEPSTQAHGTEVCACHVCSCEKVGLFLQNQMQQSLWLFEQEINKPRLKQTTIVLLFTKLDLFAAKTHNSPIDQTFPDFNRDNDDLEAARRFFTDKFFSIIKDPLKQIHVFCTDLTDSDISTPILTEIMDLAEDAHRHKRHPHTSDIQRHSASEIVSIGKDGIEELIDMDLLRPFFPEGIPVNGKSRRAKPLLNSFRKKPPQ